AATLVALVWGTVVCARGLAARLVPDWWGPPAWLGQAVLAVGVVIVTAEVLGTVGLFRRIPLVLVVVVLALVLRRRARADSIDKPPAATRATTVAAAVMVAGLVARWAGHVASSWGRGMLDGDT